MDSLLFHTKNPVDHLKVLDELLQQLKLNHPQNQLGQMFLGKKAVSQLGFMLTWEGIKLSHKKLKAIKYAKRQPMLKPFNLLCATSSGPILRILPSLLHHCLPYSQGFRIQRGTSTQRRHRQLYHPQEHTHI
jgi:hypothetical protein